MRFFLCVLAATALLGGCGGGGPVSISQPTGEITAGTMRLTGILNSPQVFTGSATVYALSGTITKAIMHDATPTAEETEVVFQRAGVTGWEMMACSPDGTGIRKICDLAEQSALFQVNAAATYVYFLIANGNAYRVPFGGGSPALLKSGVGSFDLTPSGNKIVYYKLSGPGWWTANADFSGELLITSDPTPLDLGGAINENLAVLYSQANDNMYALDLTPGSSIVLKLTKAELNDVHCYENGDGFGYHYSSGAWHYLITVNTGPTSNTTWTEHFEAAYAGNLGFISGFSPDHRMVMFGQPTVNKSTVFPLDLTSETIISQDIGSQASGWGPYITTRTFVGTATWPGAAAVILCEAGSSAPSVVLADATTRSSMGITRVSQPGDSNVVLKLTCDALTKLHYTVGNNYNLRAVVSGNTGLKGAFVSLNAANGQVSTVLTFTATPTTRRVNGHIVVEGPGIQLAVGPEGPISGQRIVL